MRRVHEASLLIGIGLLIALLRYAPSASRIVTHICLGIVLVTFAISTAFAFLIALRSRTAPLPARTVATYLLATLGVAFLTEAGISDIWLHLSYPSRFSFMLVTLCALFVIPWLFTEFRALHRTPLAFDAALVPLIGLLLYQVSHSQFRVETFWDMEFWIAFGLPAFLLSYLEMRRAVGRERSTFVPLCICTAVLYVLMEVTCPSGCFY